MGCVQTKHKQIHNSQNQKEGIVKELQLKSQSSKDQMSHSQQTCLTLQQQNNKNSARSLNHDFENMLKSIEHSIPQHHTKESYILCRRQVRIERNEKENPAPVIHSNVQESYIIKKRAALYQKITTELQIQDIDSERSPHSISQQ